MGVGVGLGVSLGLGLRMCLLLGSAFLGLQGSHALVVGILVVAGVVVDALRHGTHDSGRGGGGRGGGGGDGGGGGGAGRARHPRRVGGGGWSPMVISGEMPCEAGSDSSDGDGDDMAVRRPGCCSG